MHQSGTSTVPEEILIDYGIKDKDLPWLKSDAKKIGTTLDQDKLMDIITELYI